MRREWPRECGYGRRKNKRSEDWTKGWNTLSYLKLHRSFQLELTTVLCSNTPGDSPILDLLLHVSAALLGYELCESRGYLVNLWSSPLADTEPSTSLINGKGPKNIQLGRTSMII